MNTTWGNLPKELLLMILNDRILNNIDWLQLQLVCKNWSAVASEKLYNGIHLSSVKVPSLLKTLIQSERRLGLHMKCIYITSCFSDKAYAYDDLLAMLRQCPNIEFIGGIISEPIKTLFADIERLHSQGYLQHLQEIPEISYVELDSVAKKASLKDTYVKAAFALKKTLTGLVINSNGPNESEQPSPKKPRINLLQHLQDFSRLKTLVITRTTSELLFETITSITQHASRLEKLDLYLDNSQAALQINQCPVLAPSKLSVRPNIKQLRIITRTITSKDIQCIQHVFNGLAYFSINIPDDRQKGSNLDIASADGAPSPAAYIGLFNHVVSFGEFTIDGLSVAYCIDKILAYWSKHPRVNTLNIRQSMKTSQDIVLLTATTSLISTELDDFADRDDDDDGWLVGLDVYGQHFEHVYQQALEQLSGDTIEHITLNGSLELGLHSTGGVGSSLGYIIDHYTAARKIYLDCTVISSFRAETTGNRLEALVFNRCIVESSVLTQLSSSTTIIDQFYYHTCVMLENGLYSERAMTINMPETAFGKVEVRHDEVDGSGQLSYIVKVCTSSPTRKTHYFKLNADEIQHLEEPVYEQMTSDNRDGGPQMEVTLICQSLKSFSIASNSYELA